MNCSEQIIEPNVQNVTTGINLLLYDFNILQEAELGTGFKKLVII